MDGMRCIPRGILVLLLASAAAEAHAYCVYNDLRDRTIAVVQEEHPERSRDPRKLNITLAPGQSQCCKVQNLDCNPGGWEDSVVGLIVSIVEEPGIKCGSVSSKSREHQVSVTGIGTLRVTPNPRKSETIPYVIRTRARDKDLSGPAGIACRKPSRE